MFRRNCGSHGYRSQKVTQAAQEENDKESETDAEQRVEERLHADAVDDVNEQGEAENEGQGLKPNEGSARVAGTGFWFFGEVFCFTGGPAICELFSRFNQGVALTPIAVALGRSGALGSSSLTTRPGNFLNPFSHNSGTGLLSSRKFPVNASSVGT